MITHRCKESLKHHASIRKYDGCDWRLSIAVWDNDYDVTYLRYVCIINYCPFCGKKLEVK